MPDTNTIELLGLVLKPVHFSAASLIFEVVLALGVFAGVKSMIASRGNRELDIYIDQRNDISEIDTDGFRTLAIHNMGDYRRVEQAFPISKTRKHLLAAAARCDKVHRFIKCTKPHHQQAVLRAARGSLLRHFVAGEVATFGGAPVKEVEILLSLTGADTEDEGVKMIRVVITKASDLRIIYEHPEKMWKFKGDKERMLVRLQTLRHMAKAFLEDDGKRLADDGSMIQIIETANVLYPIESKGDTTILSFLTEQ